MILKIAYIPCIVLFLTITSAYAHEDHQVYYYSLSNQVPNGADYSMLENAAYEAFNEYSIINHGLDFEEGSGMINIRWVHEQVHQENIYCNLGEPCDMKVPVLTTSCDGNYIYMDEQKIKNNIMHQIGHVLKITHHDHVNHVMYDENYNGVFDDNEHEIPKYLKGYYVGEKEDFKRIFLINYYVEKLDQIYDVVERIIYVLNDEYLKTADGLILEKLNRMISLEIKLDDKIEELTTMDEELTKQYECKYG